MSGRPHKWLGPPYFGDEKRHGGGKFDRWYAEMLVSSDVEKRAGRAPENEWAQLRGPTRRLGPQTSSAVGLAPAAPSHSQLRGRIPMRPRSTHSPTWTDVLRRSPACVIVGGITRLRVEPGQK